MKPELKLILALILVIISITSLIIGYEKEIGDPIPCVDGRGKMNLEGIMCENTEYYFFGLPGWLMLFFLPLILLLEWIIIKNIEEIRHK